VQETIRDPSQDIKNHMLVRREDVAYVGTVEDVLESWEHLDPDVRPIFSGDESAEEMLAGDLCTRHATREGEGTYRALKKKTSQVRMGRKGSRNWRVTGTSRPIMTSEDTPIFTMGLGAWLMERQKMPIRIRIRYWPS
jgi:hypothetical protein